MAKDPLKSQQELNEAKEAFLKLTKESVSLTEQEKKKFEKLAKTMDKYMSKSEKATKKYYKDMEKSAGKSVDAIQDDFLKGTKDSWSKAIKIAEREQANLEKRLRNRHQNDQTKRLKDVKDYLRKKAALELQREQKSSGKGVLKFAYGKFKEAKGDSKKMGALGESLIGMSKGAGSLGKVLKPLGVAMKGLAVPLAAITGLFAVADTILDLDQYMKDLNKTFANMAGPQFGAAEFEAESRKFNKAIHDGMDLGLLKDEMHAFYQSMNDAGLSLKGVIDHTGDYSKAVTQARDISMEMGMDMATTGHLMSDQFMSMNVSLQSVRESFNSIANDAKDAGISSMQFYNAISASTLALGVYGNYLKQASSMLKSFEASSGTTKKTATEMTKSITDWLANVTNDQALKALSMGGYETEGKRQALVEDELKSLRGKRAATTDDKEKLRLDTLINSLEAIKGDLNTNAGAFLQQLGPEFAKKLAMGIRDVKGAGSDVVTGKLFSEIGLGGETLARNMRLAEEGFKTQLSYLNDILANEKARKFLLDNSALIEKGDFEGIIKGLKDQGIQGNLLLGLEGLFKANSGLTKGALTTGINTGSVDTGAMAKSYMKEASDSKKRRITDSKEMIAQRTSIQEQVKIAKEQFKFIAADSDVARYAASLAQQTVGKLGDILSLMMHSGIFSGAKNRAEKEKAKNTRENFTKTNIDTALGKSKAYGSMEKKAKEFKTQEELVSSLVGGGFDDMIAKTGSSKDSLTKIAKEKGTEAFIKHVSTLKSKLVTTAAGIDTQGESMGVKSIVPSYATGGIVGGNSLTGDRIPIRVNSKERILTQRDQGTLTKVLDGRAGAGTGQEKSVQVSMHVNVEGVSGEEVATAIEKRFKQEKFWKSMG